MSHLTPTLLLIFITMVWGWSFTLVKNAISTHGALSFLVMRFVIASIVMGAISARKITRASLIDGTIIGLALVASYLTQTLGQRFTTVTNSGLITGLFVVFAPLANRALFGVRTKWGCWVAIGASLIGLALLTDAGNGSLNIGDLLTLVGAAFIGLYIALLDRFAKDHDTGALATVQIFVSTLVCLLAWVLARIVETWFLGSAVAARADVPMDPLPWPMGSLWFALMITALISTSAGAYVQTYVQKRLSAIRVTVIVSLTPVFAALFGILLAGDNLTRIEATGAVMMISAVMAVEIINKR